MRPTRLTVFGLSALLSATLLAGVGAAPDASAVGESPAVGTSGAAVSSGGTAAPAQSAVIAAALAADRYPCRGYGGFNNYNPYEQVARDVFKWEYPAVKVGDGKHNINWKLDPYKKPSWRTWFHALYWTGAAIHKTTSGMTAQRDPKAIDHAVAIANDWVRKNPYPWPTGAGAGNATMTRTDHLLCLRGALERQGRPSPAWLDRSLEQHAAWLKANIWPDHNVGTDQLIAMLGVGCVLNKPAIRDEAAKTLAGRITRVIDSQGANNEQSPGYARWNYELWGQAHRALDACGVNSSAARTIKTRRALAMSFLDHSTAPDGNLALIGDTEPYRLDPDMSPAQAWILSNGAAGAPPAARVAVYSAGFVFGRSGWGQGARKPAQESFYTLHYGPMRVGHGHNDHTAMTWATRGRDILVDPGKGEYVDDAWRAFYTGISGHNQLGTPQMRTSQVTTLTRRATATGADYYQLADAPYKGATRTRDVIFLSDPDIVVTFDRMRAPKATTFTQYWHLAHDQALSVSGARASAVKRGDATRTTLLQLPVGATKPSAFTAVRGATKPIQGWVWTSPTRKVPAPVAMVTRQGTSAAVATAVVAGPSNAAVSVSTRVSGATTTYSFTVGRQRAVVTLAADGTLKRTR